MEEVILNYVRSVVFVAMVLQFRVQLVLIVHKLAHLNQLTVPREVFVLVENTSTNAILDLSRQEIHPNAHHVKLVITAIR